MSGERGALAFTEEELRILSRLLELRREFRALQKAPPADGREAGGREQRAAQLREEWRKLKQEAERARSRRMYFLGHSDLLDAGSIE